jgi:hypothetical protein
MRVIAEIPQSRVVEIRKFDKATVEVPSLNKWIQVKSMTIVPTADPRTHSTRVRLDLARDEKSVYPGVYARAHFAVGRAKKLVIPVQSVIRRSEVTAVFVLGEKGGATLRQIRLGEPAAEGLVEVLSGLQAGERIALEPVKAGMASPPRKASGS